MVLLGASRRLSLDLANSIHQLALLQSAVESVVESSRGIDPTIWIASDSGDDGDGRISTVLIPMEQAQRVQALLAALGSVM